MSLWLAKMSYKEKKTLYNHLAELIMNNILHTEIDQVYHVSEIKKAVAKANKYKRKGKIIVGFDSNLVNKYNAIQ